MDQPAPDLLSTTFHRTDCIFLGCVTNRFKNSDKSVCRQHSNARVGDDPQLP